MSEARWERRLAREKARTAELERVIETKTRELYLANEALRSHNEGLEEQVAARTEDLKRALGKAEAASEAKTEFLAQMSHELRTPLHGLNGTIDALTRTRMDAEQQRLLELCQSSGSRLMRVIGDILDFSRIESGHLELEQRALCVQDLVHTATSSFAAAAEQKGLRLSGETHAPEPIWILADAHRLQQVLANLLSNAVKFTDAGQIGLHAVTQSLTEGRVRISWQVSDSGCGMSAEAADKVFDAFIQAEAGTARRFGGTGLGLSIVRGIVEVMGGAIEVESEPGKGTIFTFSTEHSITAAEEAGAEPDQIELDLSGETVLVVDDHRINRMLCETMLRDTGCVVVMAESGPEAILAAATHDPAFILMDCHMPGMTGLEATRTIRASGYEKPILAASADVTKENAEEVLRVGMQGILGKPFRQRDLFEAMARHLPRPAGAPAEYSVEAAPLFHEAGALEIAGDASTLRQLCDLFLQELNESKNRLVEALASRDPELQALQAHGMKGASSVLCLIRLRDLAAHLEEMGRKGSIAPDLVDTVEEVVADTERVLRDFLAAGASVTTPLD